MKRIFTIFSALLATVAMSVSCTDFLKEKPVTFVSPEDFYSTEAEIEQATLGCYVNVRQGLFENYGSAGCEPYFLFERLTGNVESNHGIGSNIGLPINDSNADTDIMWHYYYASIENCNGTIAGIEGSTANVSQAIKDRDEAECYFLRAYYYFNLVRFFGPIPYKTEVTSGTDDAALPCTSEEEVYAGIVADLQAAEQHFESAGTSMALTNGRAGLGAAKALLAKVYLTMAGYPLQKTECYQKAYDKALEVVTSGDFSLFADHTEWRKAMNAGTTGENIFSVQCDKENATNYIHRSLLPYPYTTAIAEGEEYGGHMLPTQNFYDSFDEGDERKTAFFYKSYAAKEGGSTVEFSQPYIFKFFDEDAISSGKSGCKFPIIRYADVLLTLAEAACQGSSTTDAAALSAFNAVHTRAVKGDTKSSITADQVLVERFYEFCFEDQNWFDMLRTRKAFNPGSKAMVNMLGYKAETCPGAYDESYLYAPYPERDYALNPNLHR